MDSLGASDTHQEVIRAALSSPNPQEALDL